MSSTISMRDMLEAGVHFGHQTRYWSPKMAPYIFGARNKIHIINLEKTLPMYNDAVNYIGQVASKGGSVLFVGTKKSAGEVIAEEATRCGSPYVDHRWLGGMLTNNRTLRKSIKRLDELDAQVESGILEKVTKKEGLTIQRERDKLNRSLAGIRKMRGMPDVMFVIDVNYEQIAVKEARKLGIPVVAVVDTNSSPEGVDYIIPGNDDAIRSIKLYLQGVADAIITGKETAKNTMAKSSADDAYVDADEADKKPAKAKAKAKDEEKPKATVRKKVTKKIAKAEEVAVAEEAPAAAEETKAAE